jgi:hypothetical protein
MKSNIYAMIMTFTVIILVGCAQQPPKCGDDKTVNMVKQTISEQIKNKLDNKISEKEFQDNMKVEYPRASAYDEKIKKYRCEGKLIAGKTYELPITYESQLDDKNQHIVSVGTISYASIFGKPVSGDLVNVKNAIETNIAKNKPPEPAPTQQSASKPATAK